MKEIKATAPTPQDWIELVRENERLKLIEKNLHNFLFDNASSLKDGHFYDLRGILRNKTND